MPAKRKPRVALTIGGSDPGGGAGIQADLKTFAACGVYGYSALTAIIAQNSRRVAQVVAVEPAMLTAQIAILVEEHRPEAIKTGALASAENVQAVADAIRELRLPAPVVDPVMISSSGTRLLDVAGEDKIKSKLFPLAMLVTPNIPEAEALSGMAIGGASAARAAARAIRKFGPQAVLIKGGHAPTGNAKESNEKVVDLLFDGRRFVEFSGARILGGGAHGTGCAFASAITAHLAKGWDLETSIRRARLFMTQALRRSFTLGEGRPLLDHFARA